MTIRQAPAVGRTICLLLILLLASAVSAVTQDNLEELQIFDDAITERDAEDKSIEINQSKSEELPAVPEESKPRFIKSTTDESLGMDSLTIIWYLTTFTALLGFFVVMACTENSCGRRRNLKPPETRTCPPTPCPSYKHFAPPSYDTVMKKYKNQRVFIVPVHENNNFFNQNTTDNGAQNPATATRIEIEKSDEISV